MNETLTESVKVLESTDEERALELGEFIQLLDAIFTLIAHAPQGGYVWRLEYYVRTKRTYLEVAFTPYHDGRVVMYRRYFYDGERENLERLRGNAYSRRPHQRRRTAGKGAPGAEPPEEAPPAPVSELETQPPASDVVVAPVEQTTLFPTPPSGGTNESEDP